MPLLSPLLMALLLIVHLRVPIILQTRGAAPSTTAQNDEIPEWLKKAVEEQSRHSQDNTLTQVEGGVGILVNLTVLGVVIFKGGALAKQVEINTKDIDKMQTRQDEIEGRLAQCPLLAERAVERAKAAHV